MHTLAWVVGLLFFAICVVPLALAWHYQEILIFCPDAEKFLGPLEPGYASPADWNLPYEDLFTETPSGQKNHAWLMKAKNSKSRPTVIFFHGNAGTINRRLPFYTLLYNALNVNVVGSSYRGYEQSTGVPGEDAFNEDAELLVKLLSNRSDIDPSKLIVFGRSIGGAVAVDVAVKCPSVRGVIVENTFWSLGEVAREVYTPLAYIGFLDSLLRHKFDTGVKIPKIKQSIMFISGDSDELVPPSHMRQLYKKATAAKSRTWVLVGKGTHNDTWTVDQRGYVEALRNFIQRIITDSDIKDVEVKVNSPRDLETEFVKPQFIERLRTVFQAEPMSSKKEL